MKTLFFICLAACHLYLNAQDAGTVIYEQKIDLHRNLPADRQDMRDMMPQYNTSYFELLFSGNKSIYQPKKEEEITETTTSTGGMTMRMRIGRENRTVFKDLGENRMVDSRDFMQKQFLITGPPTERKWKIGKNQKEILGYSCLEAFCQVDSATAVKAWFSTQIATSNGPSDYQGLPGMILQIDINDGERMLTATRISFDPPDPALITAPAKGKEVTAAEFEKIREEKMKEMNMQQGASGGHQMIMIHRN
jgi:GLPGLI family protein